MIRSREVDTKSESVQRENHFMQENSLPLSLSLFKRLGINMKYISLFAGIGGFDLALNRQGHECVYVNEWDKYAAQTYEKNFGHKPDTRSIADAPTTDIPNHDILVGGFPCQPFSVAGLRGGFSDTRGTLFFEIARILKDKRPTYLLLENVKGLLSHDDARTFQTIMRTLDELGYELQWQVLNSKNFGVPQNRERVFIVGHLRGTPRPEVFPIIGQGRSYTSLEKSTKTAIARTLTGGGHTGGNHSGMTIIKRMPLKFLDRNQRNIEGDYSFTVDSMNTGGIMVSKTVRSGGRASPPGSKQNWDSYEVEGKIRRLTPLECERLQGFPDGWTNVTKSSIMEICVNINPAIEKLLPKLDTVSCTISVGKDMVRQICSSEKNLPVTFAIDGLLLESSATDIIKAGNAMETHYNPKEILPTDTKTQRSHTDEKTGEKSTYKLWKIILAENLPKEKLSIILTSINEIMTSPIFSSVNQEQNIIGYIILSNSQEQSYTKGKEYPLMVTNTKSLMSDTQRYKQLGNAVTVNVVEEIMRKMTDAIR